MDRFIKFKRLEREGRVITLQIDEVLWGAHKDYDGNLVAIERGNCGHFRLCRDFDIISGTHPEFREQALYIQGNCPHHDSIVVSKEFSSTEEATEIFNALKAIEVGLITFTSLNLQDIAGRIDWGSENLRDFNYIAQDEDGTIRGYSRQPSINIHGTCYNAIPDDRFVCTLQCASPIGMPFVTMILKRPERPKEDLVESLKLAIESIEAGRDAVEILETVLRGLKDERV